MMSPHLEKHGVELIVQKTNQSCICLCNPHGVSQALMNLILNAIDASASSENPKIIIKTTCDPQWMSIIVNDNGTGIPWEMRERIFEPFYSTKEPGKGTGLGLSVSHNIVAAHGGTLTAANTDTGAMFKMMLPHAEAEKSRKA